MCMFLIWMKTGFRMPWGTEGVGLHSCQCPLKKVEGKHQSMHILNNCKEQEFHPEWDLMSNFCD